MQDTTRAETTLYRAAVVAILALALALRLVNLSGQSLWVDEVSTYNVVSGARNLEREPHPPLYYWTMLLSVQSSRLESILRLPSLITGVLGVGLMYWAGKPLFDPTTHLRAVLLAGLSPVLVWHSQFLMMNTCFPPQAHYE